MTRNSVAVVLVLVASAARADDRSSSFGGVIAPAALPSGGASAYAILGVPEIEAGYRQGFGLIELEGRLKLDYLELALAAEALLKVRVLHGSALDVAPWIGVGLVGDTGAQYLVPSNFAYLAVRGLLGVTATYRLAETVSAVGQLELPYDYALTPRGGAQFRPLAGGGAEIYLGQDVTTLVLGELGPSVLKQPGGVPIVSLGYAVRLGIGFRLF